MKTAALYTTVFTAISLASGKLSLYAQCGGLEYHGESACPEGASCQEMNPYYSQCITGTVAASVSSAIAAASATTDGCKSESAATSFPVARASGVVQMYGQCGGMNWSGSTECEAPAVCTFSNPYYSQCLQPSNNEGGATTQAATTVVASPTAKTSSASRSIVFVTSTVTASSTSVAKPATSSTSVTSSTAVVTSSAAQPARTEVSTVAGFLPGVNMAGYDFGISTDGSSNGSPVDPPTAQFSHFAAQGVKVFRIPFGWQYMQPTLGGALDSTFFARYDATVKTALSQSNSPYVILDLHNYARRNGAVVGQGGPTNDQFANVWSQLAAKYKNEPRIIFGIMNEPHDITVAPWIQSVQAAVTAIRKAGATSQTILIPGSTWSHASALPTEAGPGLLSVKDTDGSVDKIVFDVHQYLDGDGSGTSTECVTDNVNVFTSLTNWLKSNGNRKAFLSETGGGNTASCEKLFANLLSYIKNNSASYLGFTVWSAGAFDTSYALSVTPNGNTDSALWNAAVKPLL